MSSRRIRFCFCGSFFAGLALLTEIKPASAQPCIGLGDIDGSGQVGLDDLGLIAQCLGGPGVVSPPVDCGSASFTAIDLDADGDADLHDVALFQRETGSEYFPYGPELLDDEAEQLAMILSGELRAPLDEYERIQGDLAKIRAAHPELQNVVDDPDFVPDHLLVGINNALPLDAYHALNDFYLVTNEQIIGSFRVLTFCDDINAIALAPIYEALPVVTFAEPDGLIGTSNKITVQKKAGGTYGYVIEDGFCDCFDGCDCKRTWVIDVRANGQVILISVTESGFGHCNFETDSC